MAGVSYGWIKKACSKGEQYDRQNQLAKTFLLMCERIQYLGNEENGC